MLLSRRDCLSCSVLESFQDSLYVLIVVLLLLIIFSNCYKLLCLWYFKLTISPLLSTAQAPVTQSIEGESIGDASSRYFHQGHFLEGLFLLPISLRNYDPVVGLKFHKDHFFHSQTMRCSCSILCVLFYPHDKTTTYKMRRPLGPCNWTMVTNPH
jgi:hypothetical protein